MPQRPTSKDVATLAGVSRTTVSFVMNDRSDVKIPEETRRRVRDAARELGYHPHASARRLAGGRSHVLALVLRQSPEQVAGDAVLAETLRGLAAAARTGGFRVMVEPFALDDPMVTYTALLRAQHADGLVISGPRVDDPFLAELVRDGFPIVLQGALPNIDAPSVDVDNVAGARGAVEHLISLGHKRIGYIAGPPGFRSAIERLAGFREALAARSIQFGPELIVEGGYTYESGVAGGEKLLALSPRPTAIFASNDEMAAGVYRVANRLGLAVPGDLSIVGFDDGPLASRLLPSLTTIRLPIRELGRLAANKILHPEAAGGTHAMVTPLEPHLVIRDSCQPPPR